MPGCFELNRKERKERREKQRTYFNVKYGTLNTTLGF